MPPAPAKSAPATTAAAKPDNGKKKKPTPAPSEPKPAAPSAASKTETAEVAEAPAAEQREVIYPTVTAEICMGDNAITVDTMKMLLGWETERDYAARMIAENP